MPNEFQYTELSTLSTIRLIKIQKEKVNDTIVCVLCYAEQTDIEYYALSYVWGDATPTREIHIKTDDAADSESFVFPLHENLWRFLDWAWHQGKFDRWFWTDRICLNQRDNKEKAHQIPQMGEIFQNAMQVISWLNESQKVGQILEHVHKLIPHNESHWSVRNATKSVMSNEYWKRIWIVQEVVRAKQVIVVIGNLEIDFEHVWGKFDMPGQNALEFIRHLRVVGECELWDVLRESTTLKSERLQDRVYGALGLLSANRDGTSPRDFIDIDYDKPPSHVFLEAVFESQLSYTNWSAISKRTGLAEVAGLFKVNEMVQESVPDLLREFMASDRTSKRHKELGHHALRAYNALDFVISTTRWEQSPENFRYSFKYLLDDLYQSRFTPNVQDRAIVMGIFLAIESCCRAKSLHLIREHNLAQYSVWKHAAYLAKRRLGWASKIREEASRVDYLGARYDEQLVHPMKQCEAKRSMIFEIPEAGFRLVLQSSEYVTRSSSLLRLGIQIEILLQFYHPTTARQGGADENNDTKHSLARRTIGRIIPVECSFSHRHLDNTIPPVLKRHPWASLEARGHDESVKRRHI